MQEHKHRDLERRSQATRVEELHFEHHLYAVIYHHTCNSQNEKQAHKKDMS